jgi:hypothetical protein
VANTRSLETAVKLLLVKIIKENTLNADVVQGVFSEKIKKKHV